MRHSLRNVSWMGEVTPSQGTPALRTPESCRSPCTVPVCRVTEVPLSWTLVICPSCPLCTETMDRAVPPPHAAGTGAVQSVGAEQRLAAAQSPPRAGQSQQGPQGQQHWLPWMGCHGNPARSCICHQGGQIANRQLARSPRGGVASGVSSAADNLGQCGGERNEGCLGTAPQSGWHCCSCALLRAVAV